MGMNTVGKRQAIDHDVYLSCSEVVPDQAGHRSRNTSVCRRIFRMVGRDAQRCPVRICDQIWIPPADTNGGYGTPEVVGKLGIPAADCGIRRADGVPQSAKTQAPRHTAQVNATGAWGTARWRTMRCPGPAVDSRRIQNPNPESSPPHRAMLGSGGGGGMFGPVVEGLGLWSSMSPPPGFTTLQVPVPTVSKVAPPLAKQRVATRYKTLPELLPSGF